MTKPLDDDAAKQARLLHAQGVAAAIIAQALGYDPQETTDAIHGASFQHITDPPPAPNSSYARQRTHGRKFDGPRLKAIRILRLGLSGSEFALEVKTAAHSLGYTDLQCNKRLVQKWENGEHGMPRRPYLEALTLVTGETIETLCTPIPPADPGEAAQQVAKIIEEYTGLFQGPLQKLYDVLDYLNLRASPSREPLIDDELIQEIRDQRERGVNLDTIAARLDLSEITVQEIASDVPIPKYKVVTNAIANEARTRYRADRTLTVADLADQYGVLRSHLAWAIRGRTHATSGTKPVYTLRPEPGITP